ACPWRGWRRRRRRSCGPSATSSRRHHRVQARRRPEAGQSGFWRRHLAQACPPLWQAGDAERGHRPALAPSTAAVPQTHERARAQRGDGTDRRPRRAEKQEVTVAGEGKATNMVVAVSTYRKPLEEVEAFYPAHREWLMKHYASGRFLGSGPRMPRTGGVILARVESREEFLALLADDPFLVNGVSEYEVF